MQPNRFKPLSLANVMVLLRMKHHINLYEGIHIVREFRTEVRDFSVPEANIKEFAAMFVCCVDTPPQALWFQR